MLSMKRWAALGAVLTMLMLGSCREMALADHAGRNADTGTVQGHWWHGPGQVSQPPIYDRNVTVRHGQNVVGEAAMFWTGEAAWSINPFLASTGGNPWDCSPRDWTIVVCIADLGDPQVGGRTVVHRFDGTHVQWAVIKINVGHQGGFTDTYLKTTIRHEMGHALGMGHTLWCGYLQSVMNGTAQTPNTCQHDRDAIRYLYQAHYH